MIDRVVSLDLGWFRLLFGVITEGRIIIEQSPIWGTGHRRKALMILALAPSLVACEPTVDIPGVVRSPSITGEIVQRTFVDGSMVALETAASQVVQVDLNATRRIGDSSDGDPGDLLLYGEEPDGPWFWSGPLGGDPLIERRCATIAGPALEQGDSIVFEIGLRLPKAPDFDPAEKTDGRFTDPTRFFCIDEHGAVTRYGG